MSSEMESIFTVYILSVDIACHPNVLSVCID